MSTEESTTIPVCPVSELGPGERKIVEHEGEPIVVFNCEGEYFAIEDRCSHDDGPLGEGELDCAAGTVECPRHGSLFDLRTGKPKSLPAYEPVSIFPVEISDEIITLEV